jgi:hypothetical protein
MRICYDGEAFRRVLAMPFSDLVSAVLQFPQMPKLRGNRSLAIARQRSQLAKRQPSVTVRGSQHHIANHFAL